MGRTLALVHLAPFSYLESLNRGVLDISQLSVEGAWDGILLLNVTHGMTVRQMVVKDI